jgi:hypothetical protein
MSLKRRVERGLRDAAGVVRDRGRGDDGDDLQGMILAETCCDESIEDNVWRFKSHTLRPIFMGKVAPGELMIDPSFLKHT